MSDDISPKPSGRGRGRPFEKGRSGNPGGRRRGSRNKATLVAAGLLAGEAEALTRKAVEMALAGDSTALRLCLDRVLPPCRERTVEFRLPSIKNARTGEVRPQDISRAMNAVILALAHGEITPSEAERVAGVVETFVGAIETTKKEGFRLNLMQILATDDESDGEETGDYEEPDDYDA
jgi:Family of unknown function (DUF5681)